MKIHKYILCGYEAGWVPRCPYPHPYLFIFVDNYPSPYLYPFLRVFTLPVLGNFAGAHRGWVKLSSQWETSEENLRMRSIFINSKHFYIQVFFLHSFTFRSFIILSSFLHFDFSYHCLQNLLHSKSYQNFSLYLRFQS